MGQGYPTPFEAPCTGTPGRPVVRKISTLLSASKMRELRHRTSKPALDGLQCALFGFGLFSLSLFFSPPSDCSFLSSTMTWAPCPHGVRTRGKKSLLYDFAPLIWVHRRNSARSQPPLRIPAARVPRRPTVRPGVFSALVSLWGVPPVLL